ncbi:MAG TPA: hypothetical protein ENN22_00945 [bacterium]|nr:hypothetical protein [bacterium]
MMFFIPAAILFEKLSIMSKTSIINIEKPTAYADVVFFFIDDAIISLLLFLTATQYYAIFMPLEMVINENCRDCFITAVGIIIGRK